MTGLIYCKQFTKSPHGCSGIAYQITYDQNGNPDGAYSCNFCYTERLMSEHSVLLATQKKLEKLEVENAELRARIAALMEQVTGKDILIDELRHNLDYWKCMYHGDFKREF